MYACNLTATCNAGPLGPSLADVCSASQYLVFASLLNVLIRDKDEISGKCQRVKPVESTIGEYDFIVVGGGAAGCAVAARLSEDPKWKVLLLEAGPDESAGTQIPGVATQYLETENTWNYKTTNENYACRSTNGACVMTQAKTLGGNTGVNGMIYLRGHPSDYDHWAELGNIGWGWEDVEPYFLKNENNGEIERVGRVHHATGGPQPVERFPYLPSLGYTILNGSSQAGYGVSEDLNGDKKTGFAIIQAMQKKGVRSSSASSYLRPIRNRRNLHVSLNSYVTRIMIVNNTAVGVEYQKNGEQRSVRASREVILSGGFIQSPQLLLLSGIGPRAHLETVGIDVVKDLPGVGQNLHDHPCAIIPVTYDGDNVYDNDWAAAMQYLADQTGPLSGTGTIQVVGMLASNATTPNRPDIEVYVVSHLPGCAPGEVGALQNEGRRSLTLLPSFLYPKSRGKMELKSANPLKHPSIWMNYLGESDDVERLVDAIKMSVALLDTDAFLAYNFTIVPLEACSNHEFKSDEYWTCVARNDNYPLYHQGGTCKMGPTSDPMAVVDNRLRVRGISRLRVVDNSIMPVVPGSNTAAPAMMIGERGADLIKEDWTQRSIPRSYLRGTRRN